MEPGGTVPDSTDRRLLHAMSSESDMEAHADAALGALRESHVD